MYYVPSTTAKSYEIGIIPSKLTSSPVIAIRQCANTNSLRNNEQVFVSTALYTQIKIQTNNNAVSTFYYRGIITIIVTFINLRMFFGALH